MFEQHISYSEEWQFCSVEHFPGPASMPASRGGLLFLSFLVLGQAMDFTDYSYVIEEEEEDTDPIDYKDPCKADYT
ncbi:UNVERIFIED_CONTAM: hypothetical protein K2H54_035294 [Gekko kuhli]